MTEHKLDPIVGFELTEAPNRREVVTFRVLLVIAAALAFTALLVSNVVVYRAKTDSDRRLKELSAQLDCRSTLSRKVVDAQAGIDIDLAAAIAAILSADRQALAATAPGLKREAENLQAAREQLNKTDVICPLPEFTKPKPATPAATTTTP